MPRIPVPQLIDFGAHIFRAAGAPPVIAQRVSASLVKADVYGVLSHGFGLVPAYVARIQSGHIQPAALPTIARENEATALVDGHNAFGQVVGEYAMQLAIAKARASGVGIACGVRSNHVGRIGEHPELAAAEGLIGFALVNATTALVTVHGGVARAFGTHPIAFRVPVPNGRSILMDFATSAVAANKLRVARNKGAKIPYGWIVDNEGAETDDPNDFYKGGYLLPFGAHKGYGLMLMVEILAGLLSGMGAALWTAGPANGVCFMALAPDFFRPSDEFLADVRRLVDELHGTPPRDGVEAVLVPGDPEARAEATHLRDGIDIDAVSWQYILDAARSLGVEG